MVAKYDIFKKTDGSVLWVEAVEDIVKVKERLISLASQGRTIIESGIQRENSSSTCWTIARSHVRWFPRIQ
jgi:hypothetical protein